MTFLTAAPILTENSLFAAIGKIFHPIFVAVADTLAFIYGVIPNYAIAIILLTILIMGLLTPLTVKSTKSMIAMQRMQPEIKRLQAKYKGAENREELNKELMRLYKEEGINPAGGCIPVLIQMPFLIVLYDVLKGLTNTVTVHGQVIAQPRYIPHSSKMYHDLVASHGAMYAFGMNLALKPFSHHGSVWAAIPYYVFVAVAVFLQYFQMKQMNSRNPQAAQANPQMQNIQKIMPIFFAYIYFIVPAGVTLYMIVSSAIRILTQDVIFRTGIVQPVGARTVPGAAKGDVVDAKSTPVAEGGLRGRWKALTTPVTGTSDAATPPKDAPGPSSTTTNGGGAKAPSPKAEPSSGSSGGSTGAAKASNGSSGGNANGAPAPPPKSHPRSKAKRTRKAR